MQLTPQHIKAILKYLNRTQVTGIEEVSEMYEIINILYKTAQSSQPKQDKPPIIKNE